MVPKSGSLNSGRPEGRLLSSLVELQSRSGWQNGESEIEPRNDEGRSDKPGKKSKAAKDRLF